MTNFFILLAAIILGILYSVYLRDTVGYLSLPPIVGLISLGGWTAFSAETLFTTWLPWYLYLLHFFWQAAHIMVYYPLHIPGDIAIKRNIAVPAAFFFTPSAKSAVAIGIGFLSLTLLLSILLPLFAQPQLGYLYLVLIVITGVYALMSSVTFWRDVSDAKKGLRAFTSLSVFRLVTVVAILLDTIFPGLKVQM